MQTLPGKGFWLDKLAELKTIHRRTTNAENREFIKSQIEAYRIAIQALFGEIS